MIQKKNIILGAAIAGVALGASLTASAKEVECWGINACQGKAGCAVKKEHVEAVKKDSELSKKFTNLKEHACGGKNACGAGKGNLEFVKKTKEECKKENGYIFEKGKFVKA